MKADTIFAFVFSTSGRTAQYAFYPGNDFAYRERLGDVVVGADIETYDGIVFRVFGRAEYDGYMRSFGLTFELLRQFESACFSHHDIEKDKRVLGEILFQGFFGVIGDVDQKPFYFEVELQYLAL